MATSCCIQRKMMKIILKMSKHVTNEDQRHFQELDQDGAIKTLLVLLHKACMFWGVCPPPLLNRIGLTPHREKGL